VYRYSSDTGSWTLNAAFYRVSLLIPDQIAALRDRLKDRQLDVLFVNAGVKNDDGQTIVDVTTEEFVRVMVTNALSPMRVIEAFEPLVRSNGTIGVMSSGQGSLSNNTNGNYEVYRGSKAALNMLMRSFAARLTIEDSIPNLLTTMETYAGRPGLHYLDYLGRVVPW